jgi:hypothetical protein
MSPEQLESYMRRQNMGYKIKIDEHGVTRLEFRFEMRSYSEPNHGTKLLDISVAMSRDNSSLRIVADNVYLTSQAKDVGALCEHLLWVNHQMAFARFTLDRLTGAVHCVADVPVKNSNLSLHDFSTLLHSIPVMIDSHHKQTEAVLLTGEIPKPVPETEAFKGVLRDIIETITTPEEMREFFEACLSVVSELPKQEETKHETESEETSRDDTDRDARDDDGEDLSDEPRRGGGI